MTDRDTLAIKAGVFALWAILVLWTFFRRFPFINLVEILANGVVLLFLLAGMTAIGRRIFRMVHRPFSSFAEELSFSFGLGSGVVILLMIGLAAVGALYKWIVVLLILGIVALVYRDLKALCVQTWQALAVFGAHRRSWAETLVLWLLILAGASTFLAAATPPFFYDAMVYHLALPSKYLIRHGFHALPHDFFSGFPANVSMLFMVGLSFSGGMLAKLISWSFAPMTALAVYGVVKSRWDAPMAVLAAAITFLTPGVLILSTLVSVDLGVMFYSFLSLTAFLSWGESRERSWLVLSGIFCGLAVGTKYTALAVTFLPLLILFFWHGWERKRSFASCLSALKPVILWGLLVVGVFSPWLLKNAYYTGNPMYPYFNSMFGVEVTDATEYSYQDHMSHAFPSDGTWGKTALSFVKAPWTITMKTTRAAGKTGVIFLLCLPGLLFVKVRQQSIRYLMAFGCLAFFLWLALLPGTALRYVFQVFPSLGIVSAYILYSFPRSARVQHWITAGCGLLLLYHLGLLFGSTHVLRPYSYLLANQTEEEFLLDHGINYYPAAQYLNSQLPQEANVLCIGERRGFYFERDYVINMIKRIDEEILLYRLIVESQTVDDVVRKLRAMGVTHILLNLPEMKRLAQQYLHRDTYFVFSDEDERKRFQTLFSTRYVRPLFSQYQVEVYELLEGENL